MMESKLVALLEKGIISNPKDGVKILGNGELTKKLNVKLTHSALQQKKRLKL